MKSNMDLDKPSIFKYLVSNDTDAQWGLTVTTVGFHHITPDQEYPPQKHPEEYGFDYSKGRILNEYQLIYITRGKGTFKSKTVPQTKIKEGSLFLIAPGEWHTYKPEKDTGCDEYWVGFNGKIIDELVHNGFFQNTSEIFYMGINEELVSLYSKIIEVASEENTCFQQLMGGMVYHILSMLYYNQKKQQFGDKEIVNRVNKAKIIMHENIYNNITPEDIVQRLNLSYSWFRRAFKEYTGFSPAKYMNELKLQKAKTLLTNTSKSVKEISISLSFDNVEYFSTFFKKMTGKTPVEYRIYSTKFHKTKD
ncbi:MAG: AraC family transcriptional regulator [Rikenellaceae bacterium]|nr:AraC family transcriptional regulator [Rikenellaceae bacterium]